MEYCYVFSTQPSKALNFIPDNYRSLFSVTAAVAFRQKVLQAQIMQDEEENWVSKGSSDSKLYTLTSESSPLTKFLGPYKFIPLITVPE